MKKFLTIAAFMLFTVSSAIAADGRMGVTLKYGYFEADEASEIFSGAHSSGASPGTVTKKASGEGDVAEGEFGYASIFAEVMANEKFGIGVDYVPMALESESTSNTQTTTTASATGNNTVQIDFEDLTTIYVGAMITENFFVKAGAMKVDVITNESLGTGGAYGNTELDGTMFGMGYHVANDNGAFFRFEGNYLQFDSQTVTNSNDSNKSIKLKNLDGLSGKISLGKTF